MSKLVAGVKRGQEEGIPSISVFSLFFNFLPQRPPPSLFTATRRATIPGGGLAYESDGDARRLA